MFSKVATRWCFQTFWPARPLLFRAWRWILIWISPPTDDGRHAWLYPYFSFLAAFWVLAMSSNFYIFTSTFKTLFIWTIFLQSNQDHSNRTFQVNCAITNLKGTAVWHAHKSWYIMHSSSSLGILSLLAGVGSAPCPKDGYFLDFIVYVILYYEFILQALQNWPVCLGSRHLVQVGKCWGKDSGHARKEHSWKIIRWYRLHRSMWNLICFKF